MGFGALPDCQLLYALRMSALLFVMPGGIDVAVRAASSMMMLAVPSPLSSAMYTDSAYCGGFEVCTLPRTSAFFDASWIQLAKSTVTDWLFVVAVTNASSPATKGT